MRAFAGVLLLILLVQCAPAQRSADSSVPDAGASVPDGGVATAPDAGSPDAGPIAVTPNPIGLENQLAGTTDWQIPGDLQATGEIEGYADAVSVQHGEAVGIHVRADTAQTFTWQLFRLGWYGGKGGRLILSGGPLAVTPQPDPPIDPRTGLTECHWPVTFSIPTDPTWPSGVYLVKLTRGDGLQRYVPLVVRSDERKAAAVVQAAVATWQAYNDWLGESLYADRLGLSNGHAKEVSFDRPYQQGLGAGDLLTYEAPFVAWVESLGFDVVYVTNVDVATRDVLTGQKLFLSVGHDEYWSRSERDAVTAAIASGVSVAFLSGNTAYWQIRFEPERNGAAPNRTQVCWKDAALTDDPLRATNLVTDRWRDPRPGEPEQSLLGIMYSSWQALDVPFVVSGASHWIYAGTGVSDGDALPFVVGNESDALFTSVASPQQAILAKSPVIDRWGRPVAHNASAYTAPSGASVVAIGAASSEGLQDGAGSTARLRRPTGIAADAAGRLYVVDTGNHAVRLLANDASRTVSTIAGTGAAGLADGPAGSSRLSNPLGAAIGSDGSLYVTDAGNHRIVRIQTSAPWSASTWAGSTAGASGSADGWGTAARFNTPMGIAAGNGGLFVANSGNGAIRFVDAGGQVSTFAAGLDYPTGVTATADAVYVIETQGHGIRRIPLAAPGSGTVIAGGGWAGGFADGPASQAAFLPFFGLVAKAGTLYVADTGNNVVRSVASSGVTTWAGSRGAGGRDGDGRTATLTLPTGLALLPDGSLAIASQGDSTVRLARP